MGDGISLRVLLMGGRAQTSSLRKGERARSCQQRIVKGAPLRGKLGFALLSLKEAVIVQLTKQSPKWGEHVTDGMREVCECLRVYVGIISSLLKNPICL